MLIDQPVITEKSLAQAQNGVYTFVVDPSATKPEIAKTVAKLYGVKVKSVRVQSVKGQLVRRKTGMVKKNDWKKAIVTLKEGQSLKEFAMAETKDENHNHKETS